MVKPTSPPQNFSFPVYLIGNTSIALVKDVSELNGYESWIIRDDNEDGQDSDWKLRPFDADFVLLSQRKLGFGSSYTIDLFIDSTLDHSADPLVMRLLLISLLGIRQPDGLPEDYRDLSFDTLLAIALRLCPE